MEWFTISGWFTISITERVMSLMINKVCSDLEKSNSTIGIGGSSIEFNLIDYLCNHKEPDQIHCSWESN